MCEGWKYIEIQRKDHYVKQKEELDSKDGPQECILIFFKNSINNLG